MIQPATVDYHKLCEQRMEVPLDEALEEVIEADLQRSCIPTVNNAELMSILKVYAHYNKDVAYCQGMNFLVGFLLMYYQDEAMAFKVLVSLMKDFHLGSIYQLEMKRLKMMFF